VPCSKIASVSFLFSSFFMMAISIRSGITIEDCQAIERLQAEIWGTTEIEVTPSHLLLIIAKEGGLVLLAVANNEPVGFSFGLLGLSQHNRLKLASHMTGVLPAYQSRGVGHQLKLAQREAALARNLDLITWTFDPLQGRNAYLNLSKLGAVCKTYLRHLYGDMPDALNRGLPTDRFRVDWWIASEHVARRIAGQAPELVAAVSAYPIINPGTIRENGFPAPPPTFNLPGTPFCLVEVPADLPSLKANAPALALQWRLHTREVFEAYFGAGYTAVDLFRWEDRNYYLLQKDWQPT
jgi:predicted GNAT superfamily acetyltransferase